MEIRHQRFACSNCANAAALEGPDLSPQEVQVACMGFAGVPFLLTLFISFAMSGSYLIGPFSSNHHCRIWMFPCGMKMDQLSLPPSIMKRGYLSHPSTYELRQLHNAHIQQRDRCSMESTELDLAGTGEPWTSAIAVAELGISAASLYEQFPSAAPRLLLHRNAEPLLWSSPMVRIVGSLTSTGERPSQM